MAFAGNQAARIRFVSGVTQQVSSIQDDLANVFKEKFLKTHIVPIHEVLIEFLTGNTYVAHLSHLMMYSFESIKFKFENNNIQDVQRDWNSPEPVNEPSQTSPGISDDENYDFFVGTPYDTVPSAVDMVNNVYHSALANNFNPVKVVGAGANLTTYRKYLQAKLKAFVSVGHGNTTGIMCSDGRLSNTWVDGLGETALAPEVIYWNSCQVYNNPMKDSIESHGARTFVGGITNLKIGDSETVTKKFWQKVLSSDAAMGKTLTNLNVEYPLAGTFGIGGDKGSFS